MITSFPYRFDGTNYPAAIVEVRISTSTSREIIKVPMLVDSGASDTTFPAESIPQSFIKKISDIDDINLADGSDVDAKEVWLDNVKIEFLDAAENVVYVEELDLWIVILMGNGEALLGRDVMQRAIYIFDGENKMLTIKSFDSR